jgi:hypothetical protein
VKYNKKRFNAVETKVPESSFSSGTITKHRSPPNSKDFSEVSQTTNSSSMTTTQLGSPKSGLSLGAKIQQRAQENVPSQRKSSEEPTPHHQTTTQTYTNRALQLRQLSSKAKLESGQKKQVAAGSSSNRPVVRKQASSAVNSRNTSRTSSPYGAGSHRSHQNGQSQVWVYLRDLLILNYYSI